jgi:hypothetical protein
MPHLLFYGVRLWWFRICVIGFVFSIDLFWKSMFLRLKGAHTCFSHVYVQHEMVFLLQLGSCTFLLKV